MSGLAHAPINEQTTNARVHGNAYNTIVSPFSFVVCFDMKQCIIHRVFTNHPPLGELRTHRDYVNVDWPAPGLVPPPGRVGKPEFRGGGGAIPPPPPVTGGDGARRGGGGGEMVT